MSKPNLSSRFTKFNSVVMYIVILCFVFLFLIGYKVINKFIAMNHTTSTASANLSDVDNKNK